jgi:hypothetical protein
LHSGEWNKKIVALGSDLYTLNGEIAVDKICRYERLEQDLSEVADLLGLPDNPELPQAKSGVRKDRRSYQDILSSTDRDRVADLFHQEINWLGYTFEGVESCR